MREVILGRWSWWEIDQLRGNPQCGQTKKSPVTQVQQGFGLGCALYRVREW